MASTHHLSILVIEDNEDDHALLLAACRRAGIACQAEWERSGATALALLELGLRTGRLPDLVITDLELAGVGGHEVIERIRANPLLRTIPIMVLTDSTAGDDRRYCAAADHYFMKPRSPSGWDVVTGVIGRYAARSAHAAAAGTAPAARARGPFLMHVEDNADDRQLFALAFKGSGLAGELLQVATADEALASLRQHAQAGELPALLVLDLKLPGISGRDFLTLMRQEEFLRQVPVIILSDSDNFDDIQTCRDLYVIDYVIKPFTQRQMSEFINTFRPWILGSLSQPLTWKTYDR